MKNGLLLLLLLLLNLTSFSQLVAKIHLKEPIEGVCDNENIYSLMSYQ
jgi:hypothetical protein